MKADELGERLLDFAARVVSMVEALPARRVRQHLSDQLLRAGTSPGANYEEACAAESRRDFIHKIQISLKEVRETRYWVRLTAKVRLVAQSRVTALIDESKQLIRILSKSATTAKRNHP